MRSSVLAIGFSVLLPNHPLNRPLTQTIFGVSLTENFSSAMNSSVIAGTVTVPTAFSIRSIARGDAASTVI